MSDEWTVTFDASDAQLLSRFWRVALGYVEAEVPVGFASWDEWADRFGIPEADRHDVAAIDDPDGVRPRICFLRVPEGKTTKNRVHLDVQVGGGRGSRPWSERWPIVEERVRLLVEAGGTVLLTVDDDEAGHPDHVVMADPEGNEFCVI